MRTNREIAVAFAGGRPVWDDRLPTSKKSIMYGGPIRQ